MRVLIDTGGFAAIYNVKDQHHEAGQAIWRSAIQHRWTLLTTNYVVAETIVLLRVRAGHAAAVRFGDDVFATPVVRTIGVTPGHEADAWMLFKKFADQDFSFTDCTSFAVMRDVGIHNVFAFDHHFSIMGFERITL
jgi:predicted nucleic acid-binding protein